jgi:hypothetical protein
MGFFKALAGVGKKLLGPVINAGRTIQNIRDKGISLFNRVKDSLPGFIKGPLDAGIEFVMNNTPVGGVLRKASGLLDAGVGAGDAALSKIKEYEAQTGQPAAAQLAAIGERAQAADAPGQPEDTQQQARLENLAAAAGGQ